MSSYRARQFEKHGFEKNAFKVGASESGGRTWRDKKIHNFHIFRIPAWNFTCVFLNAYAIE